MASLEDLEATAEVVQSPKGARKPIEIEPPLHTVTFEEWKKEINEHFPELWGATKSCASVIAQLILTDVHNPFCLVLVDAPSSGKTVTLNFFAGIKDLVETLDSITPASFVSNMAGKSEAQLQKIDLLPRIKHRVLCTPEMGSMLADGEDDLRKRMGILTRILDGEGYKPASGVNGVRGYEGDYLFMMLGASTPFPLRVWKSMTGYGHRMFFLSLGTSDPDIDQLVGQLYGDGYKMMQNRCKLATEGFIRGLWERHKDGVDWDHSKNDRAVITRISEMATFLSLFRGDIIIYKDRDDFGSQTSHSKPQIEKPHRINQWLYNFARAHALVCGRDHLTMEDVEPLYDIVESTAPTPRPDFLRCLIENDGRVSAADIVRDVNIVRNTAKKEMKKLKSLGVGQIQKEGIGGIMEDVDDYDSENDNCSDNKKWVFVLDERFKWLLDYKKKK